jgi:hypothetical protein
MYDISQISKPQRFVERVEKATYTEGATGGEGGGGEYSILMKKSEERLE